MPRTSFQLRKGNRLAAGTGRWGACSKRNKKRKYKDEQAGVKKHAAGRGHGGGQVFSSASYLSKRQDVVALRVRCASLLLNPWDTSDNETKSAQAPGVGLYAAVLTSFRYHMTSAAEYEVRRMPKKISYYHMQPSSLNSLFPAKIIFWWLGESQPWESVDSQVGRSQTKSIQYIFFLRPHDHL